MPLSSRRPTVRPTFAQRKRLHIPPAWTNVRIASYLPTAKLWAIGYDEKHRRQYIYHPKWTQTASTAKFQRIGKYIRQMQHLRNKAHHHIRRMKTFHTREDILWIMIALLFETGMRISSSSSSSNAVGLTTLRPRHVHNNTLQFTGKSNQPQRFMITTPSLRRHIQHLKNLKKDLTKDLKTYLFMYHHNRIHASDINAFLHQHIGNITAKDIRTMIANQRWIEETRRLPSLSRSFTHLTKTDIKKRQRATLHAVANAIQHTPAICRKSYLHPRVWDQWNQYIDRRPIDQALRRLFTLTPM